MPCQPANSGIGGNATWLRKRQTLEAAMTFLGMRQADDPDHPFRKPTILFNQQPPPASKGDSMLTDRLSEAFCYAERLHRTQTRKGNDIPYVAI